MKIIENIKNTIGRYLLHKGIKKTTKKVEVPSFNNIHEIGIVYNATEKSNEDTILRFANYLREEGKKVFTLGYLDARTLPFNKKLHIQSEYFWKERLTPFNLPDPVKIGRFMDTHFDLLMNISFEDILSIQAISALSKAKYRMAAQIPHALSYNETLIDTGSNKDLKNLAMQMEHYLKSVQRN